jgi:enoyl-[acyl-carrier protein] reductase II
MDMSLIDYEIESIKATYEGNLEKALMAAGEVAQRINDMPEVNDMVQAIVKEAEEVVRDMPKKFIV